MFSNSAKDAFVLFLLFTFFVVLGESSEPLKEEKQPVNSIDELVPNNEDERKPLVDGSNENHGSDHGCFEGWINYRNELCFYGSQIAGSFFEGREQCGLLNANFTSVHSLREFKFITDNFDLKEYWIGLVYGAPTFEDGTQVDQEVFWQIADSVPWAHPSTLKGYICKAVADADAGVFEYKDFDEDI
uniref:C-type lectin domain-containing protein n=1 Tax=Meloidogyne javanica TaxID=6303 RepID=A0A915MGZ4_MELJA